MSRPENVLAQFRSYSYHHILIACDNDAAADYISGPDATLDTFRRIGSREPVQIDKVNNDGSTTKLDIGNYVVILNGMIDTTFVVQRAEWFTATAASTDVRDRFNSVAVEGTIEIQEPRGVRFMNALNEAADRLGSDPNGLIFLLKTIFVGHGVREDGTEFSDHITNVRPLRFVMYDVTGTFSTSGGSYVISFAGVSNGAARFPQYSRITENLSLTPKNQEGSDTMLLATALNNLAEKMTMLAQKNRDCIVNKLKEVYNNPVNEGGGTLDDLRGVKYEIVAEPPYTTGEVRPPAIDNANPAYVVDGLLAQQGDDGQGGLGPLKFGPNSTVEQAIRHIMDRCEQVKKDRTEGEDGVTYIYKIHSKLSMEGQSRDGNSEADATKNYNNIVVRYFVRRFAQVTNSTVEQVLGIDPTGRTQTPEDVQNTINQNTIEFDYFFSGKNTDIINFDIKMEMGLAFIQALATTNTLPTQIEQMTNRGVATNSLFIVAEAQKGQEDSDEDGERPARIVIRNQTPIFPATRVKDVGVRNTANPQSGALFQAYLSRHAALENLEATVTIHGNPYLMSQTNKQANETSQSDTTASAGSSAETVLQNWDTVPGLAKINIFMPSTNDTPSSQETFDLERFWYNGYYYLYGIQHKFDEGQFTQDLQLLSLPNQSLVETTRANEIEECGPTPKDQGDETGGQQTGTAQNSENPTGAEATAQTTRRPRTRGELKRARQNQGG